MCQQNNVIISYFDMTNAMANATAIVIVVLIEVIYHLNLVSDYTNDSNFVKRRQQNTKMTK
jgi:hypothetical protein